ncbi:diaminohydroxyphosphoribosylaminopyrimidine deaminase [Micromonospora purpureochromogenes]|uniref:Diaminohydroxyphosphoribosylaminopyrimidine deaminase n=1 Tax=Micromonospora purpureochromogenes TaxID=47872 RepID=A0A1C4ZPJ8_9ACTN|nr:deaminase [Micromonospora purpureochromogenes]SCF34704.1 diaminohydroxyphosphoribosylaminopyrimidine deaminase [Micromonospora purpureochromogenes]
MTPPPTLDRRWLQDAVDLSRRCPPKATAYAVGAIVVGRDGAELARGYSRETDSHVHAEESALGKLHGIDLSGATIYSSLEPCSARQRRSPTCTALILAAGIRRVVLALREPPIFVDCQGVELLAAAGVEVVELPDLADQVRAINRYVMDVPGT